MTRNQDLPGLRVVGLLGGVGAGKSFAGRALAEALPGSLFSADEEIARLLRDRAVARRIEDALGPGLLDLLGEVDRKALAAKVFGDPDARETLEGILHPAARQALHEGLERLEDRGGPVWAVLDIPLLLEGGLYVLCDFLVFVEAPDGVRSARAMARHGWSEEQWAARELAQRSLAEKKSLADAILENGGSAEHLQDQISELVVTLRSLPPRPLKDRWPAWDQLPSERPPAKRG